MADSRTRPLKKLHPEADQKNIISFLLLISNKGESLQNYDPLYIPLLENQAPKYLEFSQNLDQDFEQHQRYILPADLILLIRQALDKLLTLDQTALDTSQKTSLSGLYRLSQVVYGRDFIDSDQEQNLLNKTDFADLGQWSSVIKDGYNELLSQEVKKSGTFPKKADESKTKANPPEKKDKDFEEKPELIIDPEIQKVINSYSFLALNSSLAAYTASLSEDLPQIDLNQLEPELREALLRNIKPKIENYILGLKPQEIQALLSGEGDAFKIRLKIFQSAHRYLINNPQNKLLFQTAIDNYFHLQRQLESTKEAVQTELPTHDQANQNLEEIAADEALSNQLQQNLGFSDEQINLLSNKFGEFSNSEALLSQKLKSLLRESGLGVSEISFAAINIDRTLSVIIADDPFISPSFIEGLSYQNFSLFFGQDISKKVFKTRERQIKLLLRQFLIVKRARFTKDHPDLFDSVNTQEQISEDLTKPEQKALGKRAGRVANLRQFFKENNIEEDPLEIFNLSEDEWKKKGEDVNLLRQFKTHFWESLSEEEKQYYIKQVYKQDYSELKKDRKSWQDKKQQFVQEFKYTTYLKTKADFIDQEVRADIINQVTKLTEEAATDLQQKQAQIIKKLLESNSFLIPGQSYSIDGQQIIYSPPTGPEEFSDHVNQRVRTADNIGQRIAQKKKQLINNLSEKGLTEALDKAAIAAAPFLAAIPAPIRKAILSKISSKAIKDIKKYIKFAFGGGLVAGALLGQLLKLLGTAGSTLIGGVVGFLVGGPIGALVGAGAGGTLSALAQGKLASSPLLEPLGQHLRAGATEGLHQVSGVSNSLRSHIATEASIPAAEGSAADVAVSATQAEATPFFKTIFSEIASTSVASAVGTTAGTVAITTVVIHSAFTVNVPYSPIISTLNSEKRESPYVQIIKQTSSDPGLCSQGKCEELKEGEQATITYEITIKPKGGHTIIVKELTDKISVSFNEEKYEELYGSNADKKIKESQEIADSAKNTRTLEDFSVSEGDRIEPEDEVVISYTKLITHEYSHSSVRNNVDFKFDWEKDGRSGSSDAITGATVCVGDCPQGLGCWPTTGLITQLPYGPISHSPPKSSRMVDAFDIAAAAGTPIFAPFSGSLCKKPFDDDGYGEWLELWAMIEGEEYQFRFAHLLPGSSIVQAVASDKADCLSVQEGQFIGKMGSTGWSSGPHLHYELANSAQLKYKLSDLLPDGHSVTASFDPVVSCYSQVK